MDQALEQARAAGARGETPVGAVIYDPVANKVRAANGNRVRELSDPTAHAECLVIREACQELANERLQGLDLYVTLEPCPMCAGIISAARISRLYYGASDPKSGGFWTETGGMWGMSTGPSRVTSKTAMTRPAKLTSDPKRTRRDRDRVARWVLAIRKHISVGLMD